MMKNFLIVLMLMLTSSSLLAGQEGNGGGVWVCRNNDSSQTVRHLQFVDTFETSAEHHLEVDESMTVDFIGLKIFKINKDFYELFDKSLSYVKENWPTEGGTELATIDDALWSVKPNREDCTDGSWEYEQLINFQDDGDILVNFNHYNELKEWEKEATIVHEAIYHVMRTVYKDEDSRRSREMVAHLFSTAEMDKYTELFKLKPAKPSLDPNSLKYQKEYIEGDWEFIDHLDGGRVDHYIYRIKMTGPKVARVTTCKRRKYQETGLCVIARQVNYYYTQLSSGTIVFSSEKYYDNFKYLIRVSKKDSKKLRNLGWNKTLGRYVRNTVSVNKLR